MCFEYIHCDGNVYSMDDGSVNGFPSASKTSTPFLSTNCGGSPGRFGRIHEEDGVDVEDDDVEDDETTPLR